VKIRNLDEAQDAVQQSLHRIRSANKMDKLVQKELTALAEVVSLLVADRAAERERLREMSDR
jgi:hypothetical protein